MRFALVVALGVAPSLALADDWVVAEAPVAMAMSAAQDGLFRTGAMPAGGMYHGFGPMALGLRLRAGVLRNGPEPGNNLKDPGVGGLASAGLALRLTSHGLWIEGVGGPGVTGHDVVPAIEAGVGFNFALGAIDLGPSVRYLRLQNHDDSSAVGSADIVLVGIEVQIGKSHTRKIEPVETRPEEPMMTAAAPPAASPLVLDRDRDELAELDLDDSCVADGTGCSGDLGSELARGLAEGTVEIADDRIVLDERVLFDVNRARVRSAGREMIAAIARMWRAHPEWQRVIVEGHADVRGPDDYNLALSQRRAELARATLVHLGFAADRVDAVGYGRSRPRDPGTSDESHHRNRRVEFVIIRHGETSAPVDGARAAADRPRATVDGTRPAVDAAKPVNPTSSRFDATEAIDAAHALTTPNKSMFVEGAP